jgi:predicted small metal-binding protein
MTKVLNCRDIGFDCEAVVRADSEDEALEQVAQHAKTVHGLEEVSPELAQKAREAMKTE